MVRQQEEVHLLTLQNEQYKQTLDGQKMLVHELYKALTQSNNTVRKLRSSPPTLEFGMRRGSQSLETNSSAIEVPIMSDVAKGSKNYISHLIEFQPESSFDPTTKHAKGAKHVDKFCCPSGPSGNDIHLAIEESQRAAMIVQQQASLTTDDPSITSYALSSEEIARFARKEKKARKLAKKQKKQAMMSIENEEN